MSEFWPHQFTKKGDPVQIGEEQVYENTTVPVMAQTHVCVHCGTEYVHGKEAQPIGACPARNDKREMKRIKNG